MAETYLQACGGGEGGGLRGEGRAVGEGGRGGWGKLREEVKAVADSQYDPLHH